MLVYPEPGPTVVVGKLPELCNGLCKSAQVTVRINVQDEIPFYHRIISIPCRYLPGIGIQ